MLLLLFLMVFSGCLASCAAQTSTLGTSSTTDFPLTHSIQPTAVVNNPVAILQTAVRSSRELNETIGPVLNKLYEIIHQLQPHLNFTLTVRNVTEV